MWKVIQEILPALIVILLLTQYVIPVLLNMKTWWLFRREKKQEIKKPTNPLSLQDEIETTKVYVDEAKTKADEVIKKAEGNLKSAEDLKKEADNLKNK